ncbi:MAG: M50 family metallopeptidase [Candidatus Accumulibacter sp.]|jgi:putative peptide zinc metalloprotease protein|nr:M50 family metallopeptidase [Accumulibacter sp.]
MARGTERHSTYHEQWYLVENLTPRLRPEVFVRRQIYWGVPWYILSDPDNNAHFRLAKGGYAFVAALNGAVTVDEAWERCREAAEKRGDGGDGSERAPEDEPLTQGEAIALLGRLHSANLLLLDMPADAEEMLRRRQERRLKKLGSTLSSFLFLRIPLFSPDAFFTRFQAAGRLIFYKGGFLLWGILAFFALRALVIDWNSFVAEARQTLSPGNLIWIYVAIVLSKIIHECGHAFACKHYSAKEGLAGDVHSMGIMFLFFAPIPYIDVSSSVQLRSRWARAMVGLAGIYSEFFLAFLATLLWSESAAGSSLHLLARNFIILTSVSTLLFNINPLMRFDGYFVFSDILNLPNLYQRSQAYAIYLFKRYALGVTRATTVVRMRSERIFYPLYATAAFAYRIVITVGIYFLLEDHFAALGILLTLALAALWFVLPACKGIVWLAANPEASGERLWAWLRLSALSAGFAVFFFIVPAESAVVVEGVVESRSLRRIFAEEEGTLASFIPTDEPVEKGKSIVAVMENPGLEAEWLKTSLTVRTATAKLENARDRGDANAEGKFAHELQAAVTRREILRLEAARQRIVAPEDGVWVAPDLTRRRGKWIDKGSPLGLIYSPADLRLRAAVDQFDAARLFAEPLRRAEFCISSRMGLRSGAGRLFSAQREREPTPSGRRALFHPSLAVTAGGDLPVVAGENGEMLSASHFFELRLLPEEESLGSLRPGQKVLVRLVFDDQPLGLQVLRRVRQFFAGKAG